MSNSNKGSNVFMDETAFFINTCISAGKNSSDFIEFITDACNKQVNKDVICHFFDKADASYFLDLLFEINEYLKFIGITKVHRFF